MNSKLWEAKCIVVKEAVVDTWESCSPSEQWAQLFITKELTYMKMELADSWGGISNKFLSLEREAKYIREERIVDQGEKERGH